MELEGDNQLLRSAKEADRAAMAIALNEKEEEAAGLVAELEGCREREAKTQKRLDAAREEQRAAAKEKEELLSALATARSRTDQSAEVGESVGQWV